MIEQFITGVGLFFGTFLYTQVSRYRNLEPRPNATRRSRARRVLGKVAWLRVAALHVLTGILAIVLWYGLDEVFL